MRLARYALSAVAALCLALSAHAQELGDGCGVDLDCDSNCCLTEASPDSTCGVAEDLNNGETCFTPDGCDCLTGFCDGGTCAGCVDNDSCLSGCCASELTIVNGGAVSQRPCRRRIGMTSSEAFGAILNGLRCFSIDGCDCESGLCEPCQVDGCSGRVCTEGVPAPTPEPTVCPPGTTMCDDPHMQGLRGQSIDWSGVDGGWYCLVTDDNANLHVNVRLTAPLPEEFPDRQLITGLSILSEGHSLAVEVVNPYNVDTDGCPEGVSPCLADGGLRATVDGAEVDGLLRSSRHKYVTDRIEMSASNLPVECRQFGGDKIWARMYDEMLQGKRVLANEELFEDWILRFDHMAAADWCRQYIAEHSLADLQSNHAIFKVVTSAVTVRLNVGTNFQGNGELDWDGRVLPDLEFWQMDVGLHGLFVDSESLSGILGETARPVLDEDGHEVMKGLGAIRGEVGDYRVSGPLGTEFAYLSKQ